MQSAAINKLTGSESSQQTYRNATESQEQQHEQQATSQASIPYQAAENSQQLGIEKAQQTAQYGTSSSQAKSGNWQDYYKGWDQKAAAADYAKVYGSDLSKLQAAKPE
jgi:hypothetical protein